MFTEIYYFSKKYNFSYCKENYTFFQLVYKYHVISLNFVFVYLVYFQYDFAHKSTLNVVNHCQLLEYKPQE